MPPIDDTRARRIASATSLAGLALAAMVASAQAASPVSVELNRFESKDQTCRISFVVNNPNDKTLDSLKLDLVFFDKDGVISRRLALEAGPVRASKTTVKLFEATELPCDSVGRLLLNDVTACGGEQDCLAQVSPSSRVRGVEFSK